LQSLDTAQALGVQDANAILTEARKMMDVDDDDSAA
jgi:hypothetical protein